MVAIRYLRSVVKAIAFLSKSLPRRPETIGVVGRPGHFVSTDGPLTRRRLHKFLVRPRILWIGQARWIVVLKLGRAPLLFTRDLGGLHQVLDHGQIILATPKYFHEILARHWLTRHSCCGLATWHSLLRLVSLRRVLGWTVRSWDVPVAVLALRPRKLSTFNGLILLSYSSLWEAVAFVPKSRLVLLNVRNCTTSLSWRLLVLMSPVHNATIGLKSGTRSIRWSLRPPSITTIGFLLVRRVRLSLDV